MMFADAAVQESATIGAYILAILGLAGAIHSKYDARQVKRQADTASAIAAENERNRELDKLEHDAKLIELSTQHAACEDSWKRLSDELGECRKQHEQSEEDRKEIHRKLAKFEAFLELREERNKSM